MISSNCAPDRQAWLFIIIIALSSCESPPPLQEESARVAGAEELTSGFESIDSELNGGGNSLSLDRGVVAQDQGSDDQSDALQASASSFPAPPSGYPLFRFPIDERDLYLINPNLIFGVDHDTARGNRIRCENYDGLPFPNCYDEHRGSDFILLGGFEAMDSGSARVVAALEGEVITVVDGYYDRCHADIASADISCDGHPVRANYISVEHSNGWVSHYYHLKRDSIQVEVGDRISCGAEIGLVGSSGYSSGPHLHFEVVDSFERVWDPYAGSVSQRFSLWVDQVSDAESESFPSTSCSPP